MDLIRRLRRQAGLTQVELAAKAGTSQATLAAYETGRKSPTMRTLIRLAQAVGLHVHVEYLPALSREDRRNLAFHSAVAERLRSNPDEVIAKAKHHLPQLMRLHPHARPLLRLWSAWLDLRADDLVEEILHPGSLGCEMRQVSPFVGVLSAQERASILRDFRAEDAA